MEQASPQCMDEGAQPVAHQQDEHPAKMVVHFSVAPGATLTWRIDVDSTLTVQGARLWITRINFPYDYWLDPGHTLRLQRGERIWLSCEDTRAARVSLSCTLPAKRGVLHRWLGRLAWLSLGPPTPR
ncbi:DUF2917 domain-containing protein [Paraburkholderia sp. D15]|uniref:DUF2917 domain-containing protein n=1 Tax=Paraburkholderia sp. D15 TaxID=2880218 RepID=UPI00247B21C5|nr:DUF2917 domain-containing protein [Paraburkholderia sp. D15]WGS53876.1 DUF2917 domain-containing protein [Paraburkholderia sp. D15]WKF60591.1 hypothetical protein HUO10_005112 [Paraburkholderia busanensis]